MSWYKRPRGYPRIHQGRIWNRRRGGYAPALYGGGTRRNMHRFHGTQATTFGAGMGGWGQRHVAPHGFGGRAIQHALSQSMRGGTNLGMAPVQQGSLTSRLHPVFRRQMALQGKAAQKKRYAEVLAAGGSRAQARRQSLLARREARRHFSGGKGKGTWHNITGGDGRRRVRLHKFHHPDGSWTRYAHSIYRTHKLDKPTKRGKPYGKKAGAKMLSPKQKKTRSRNFHNMVPPSQGYIQGQSGTSQNQTSMQSRLNREWNRQRSMDRYNQRRAGWGMAPVSRLGWGFRGRQERIAPFGQDERRFAQLQRNDALRRRLGLPPARMNFEDALIAFTHGVHNQR